MAEKEFRVWWARNPPVDECEYHSVAGVEDAIKKLNELAEADLRDKAIWANAGGLEVFEDDEWSEYYDEWGRDIREIEDDEDG